MRGTLRGVGRLSMETAAHVCDSKEHTTSITSYFHIKFVRVSMYS